MDINVGLGMMSGLVLKLFLESGIEKKDCHQKGEKKE